MDLISIIVPVYKVEKYLKQCVESIINQTYNNIEIILVDDGSPDNCGKMCDEFAGKDSRIKVIHKENGGLSDARNAGISIASGDFYAFIDSDDYISSNMIELLYGLCRKCNTKISACDFIKVYESPDKLVQGSTGEEQLLTSQDFFLKMMDTEGFVEICVWNKLYHKSLFDSVLFPKGKLYEDLGTTYKLIFQTDKVAYKSEACYYYRKLREGAITSNHYSFKEAERIEMSQEMLNYIIKYQPGIQKEAAAYTCVNCDLTIANTMASSNVYDKNMLKLLRRDIIYKLSKVLTSNISIFKKCQILIFLVSFPLYKFFITSLKKT